MTDDVLDERAAALENGPCGQDGAIARVSSLLSHPGMWDAPPDLPGGIAALIAKAETDSAPAPASSVAPQAPAGPRPADTRPPRGPSADRARPGATRRRRQWATAVAVALVLIAGGIGGVLATRERPSATVQLAGGGTLPQAHGTIKIIERDAGWRLVLDAQGLPSAPAGRYYQGWAVKDGQYVALGTFHMHQEGEVELWSGVPLRQFRRIEITSQRVGEDDPGPPVLAGSL